MFTYLVFHGDTIVNVFHGDTIVNVFQGDTIVNVFHWDTIVNVAKNTCTTPSVSFITNVE